jgi:uncharacterized protein YcnI
VGEDQTKGDRRAAGARRGSRHLGRIVVAAAVAALVVVALAGTAFAHVTINPSEVPAGGFARLNFRVPNERDVPTEQLEIVFPEDHPFAFVSVLPVPGWTYEVERTALETPIESEGEEITEAVSSVTWSGGQINAGEFMEFSVSVGQLPEDPTTLEFPAIQTYQGGEVVRWIEPWPEGEEEPELPAPTVEVVASDGDEHGGATTETTMADAGVTDDASASDVTSDDVDTAQTLAIVGIVLGGIALVVGVVALVRRRNA